MIPPKPHNFSHSPVVEVFCSFMFDSGAIISLSIPAAYPGWGSIQSDIRNIITGIVPDKIITGCVLRYTDEFSRKPDSDGVGLGNIPVLKSGESRVDSGLAGSEAFVQIQHDEQRSVISFIFTVHNKNLHILSPAEILAWFDEAHTVIHHLFDRMVPGEYINELGRSP